MPDHIDHRIRQDYKDWLRECRSIGADPIPAVRICGEGYTLRELSQSSRARVRLALHLVLGLDAMASVKGWK